MTKKASRNPLERPLNRRQFLQASAAVGAGVWFASNSVTFAQMQGGTLGIMGHQEVAGLSPDDWGPSVQTTMIRAIHDSLVQDDENLVVQPNLAESYEVSADSLTYTFNLTKGVKFHNGDELTSADVKYTMDYYRDPEIASTIVNRFRNVASIDTPDDYTVVINMEAVNASFLTDGAQCPILHSGYHQEVGEEAYRQNPIGTGPFKLVEFNPASMVLVEAFDDYFRGRPNIDMVRQEVVPEPSVRNIALLTGDSDTNLWPLLVEDSQAFAEDSNYTVITTSTGGVKHFPLNNQIPQLSDKLVRKALMHALDRQRIIDDLWNGAATVAQSAYSPKFTTYSLDSMPEELTTYDFDPEKSKALLDEAGWMMGDDGIREKDGMKLSFTCTTITGDQARRPIAELAQQFFADVGVDMQLAEAPISSILDGLRNGTVDAALFNWTYGSVDPSPAVTLRSDGGQNWNSYNNPRIDELIDQGLSLTDPEDRKPIYHEIQKIVTDEVPMLYLQWDQWMNVFSGRVKGLPDSANDAFTLYYNGLRKWWIEES